MSEVEENKVNSMIDEPTFEQELNNSIKKLQQLLKRENSRIVIEVSAEKIVINDL